MTSETRISRGLVRALWTTWSRHRAPGDPQGDRIYARWCELVPTPVWEDWTWYARVHPGDAVEWLLPDCTDDHFPGLREAVQAGGCRGVLRLPGLRVEWCRATGDGPPGARVVDWLPDE